MILFRPHCWNDKKPKLDYSLEQLEKKRNEEIHLK